MDPNATHGLWADLYQPNLAPDQADISILGIPYDGAVCSRPGAAMGPSRMRFWSQHLTPFSERRIRLEGISIADLGDQTISDQERDFDRVEKIISALTNLPIVLGGDHSITIPVLRAQRKRFSNQRLGLLWLDAHPDLCDVFTGSKLSHACVLRRGLEAGIRQEDVCLVGLRSWEPQEIDLIENGAMHVFTAAQVNEAGIREVAAQVVRSLRRCEAIHISLDIDCLDPAYAPGTGIPEAGGLSTREVITLLQSLQGLPLVGLDIVEVAPPIDPSESTVFAALKLIMEFIALVASKKNGKMKG